MVRNGNAVDRLTYAVGDFVWYVIPAPVRPVWAAGVVVRADPQRRVGVLTVLSSRPRYVDASRLRLTPPPDDADIYRSVQDVTERRIFPSSTTGTQPTGV